MQAPNTPMEHLPPQHWGPHHGYPPSGAGGYGGYNMQYMPPPRQTDNYYPAAEIVSPPDRQPQQGVSAYGRKPPIGVHASSNAQSTPSFNTQVCLNASFCFLLIKTGCITVCTDFPNTV